jgi:hypothetical protein
MATVGSNTIAPPEKPGTSQASAPREAELLAAANAANPPVPGMQVRAGARMTITGKGADAQPIVIHDEAHETKQAGQYKFIVSCAGAGQVWATVRIGDQNGETAISCSDPAKAVVMPVTTEKQSDSTIVTIVPIGSAAVAAAYQIAAG